MKIISKTLFNFCIRFDSIILYNEKIPRIHLVIFYKICSHRPSQLKKNFNIAQTHFTVVD